jgi:hypothetical protein
MLNSRIMRIILSLVLFIVCIQDVSAQRRKTSRKSSSVVVNLTITQTQNWCGGARPSDEMEREFKTPKLYSNCTIYIRKDSNVLTKPILHTLSTNEYGKTSVRLTPGKYTIVNIEKKDDSVYKATINKYQNATETTGPIDVNCYNNFMAEPDFTIVVPMRSNRTITKTHNYHKHCNWSGAPCVEFRGHYPP